MNNPSVDLLKAIQWYVPACLQEIFIPSHLGDWATYVSDDEDRFGSICGIKYQCTKSVNEIEVRPTELEDVLELVPTQFTAKRPHLTEAVTLSKNIGLIGYSFKHAKAVISKNQNETYSMIHRQVSDLIHVYAPIKISTIATWGLCLESAYNAYKRGISYQLYARKRSTMVVPYWDDNSKEKLGELISVDNHTVHEYDTLQACKIAIVKDCDICVIQNRSSSSINKFLSTLAKDNNVPIVTIGIDG